MKVSLFNDWKKEVLNLRGIELLPHLSISFYRTWKFESIRIAWLGFTIGIYK